MSSTSLASFVTIGCVPQHRASRRAVSRFGVSAMMVALGRERARLVIGRPVVDGIVVPGGNVEVEAVLEPPGAIPLIRYRTGDLVCKVPASRCRCGRGFDIYEGGILGRVDDMKLVLTPLAEMPASHPAPQTKTAPAATFVSPEPAVAVAAASSRVSASL